MANYVCNIVTFNCSEEQFNKIKNFVKSENQSFDFNKIIPIPESLDIPLGSVTNTVIEIYLTVSNPDTQNFGYPKLNRKSFSKIYRKILKENVYWKPKINMGMEEISQKENYVKQYGSGKSWQELAETIMFNLNKYGSTTWYEWCVKNWSTTRNASNIIEEENGFEFNTAWTMPQNIITALSKNFPGVTITHQWADEDYGANCGEAVIKNGKVLDWYEPEGEKANAFARSVWGIEDDDEEFEEEED